MAVSILVFAAAAPASAQVPASRAYASLFVSPDPVAAAPSTPSLSLRTAFSTLPRAEDAAETTRPAPRAPRGVLPALYVGISTLQALDAHSTLRAIRAGHIEQNPLMRWTTAHPVALVSIKAAATATTILVTERIRKKHPKRAVLFMAAINAAYTAVVVHNYRAASK